MPREPMMGYRPVKEVSKPVAQMIVFTSRCAPSLVTMPLSVIRTIGSEMTLTFSSQSDSRYLGPGVNLRQPGGKSGSIWSMTDGLLVVLFFICLVNAILAPCCSDDPRCVMPWFDCSSTSIPAKRQKLDLFLVVDCGIILHLFEMPCMLCDLF